MLSFGNSRKTSAQGVKKILSLLLSAAYEARNFFTNKNPNLITIHAIKPATKLGHTKTALTRVNLSFKGSFSITRLIEVAWFSVGI